MQALPVIYQDDTLIAVNKPSGLLVHRSMIDRHETRFALQMVRDQCGRHVYPVHRLDKPTSGVLLFTFSPESARALSEQFAAHSVQKHYLAVVRGFPPEAGLIDHPLREEPDKIADRKAQADKPAKEAQTRYRTLAHCELPVSIEGYPQSRYALVECLPLSGRKHQIRRHLKHINHPIIGDAKHGRGRHNRYFRDHLDAPRLLLHAARLCLQHPLTGAPLQLDAPLDATMQRLLDRFGWLPTLPEAWLGNHTTHPTGDQHAPG
ncbi:tRNA pseudouridine(65) synthase TruC [Pseudomaricurvus sp. HS19]|uniref:tRNA pseudouridine(65) synthase TruC n=1 Tax=Pseudomaricurvus sp. HS19 TaxID=2692626 RepID=UPI00136DBBFC|nr:tRNA pseudouridine(65) synthase TruC [Pseudomaricurvus sp. HS19]MYM62307.1 tRNA pseudouridine(65) synthase TruC [Pseudomaricurvus sp. HS19]